MDQPLYDHQKAADLAALDVLSEDDLLAILGLQSSSMPGVQSLHVGSTITEESLSDVRNDVASAIRTKPPHPRVAHACDYCRRRKTKVSTQCLYSTLADVRGKCSGEHPVCTSCKKRGKACQWTPLKTTKERRSRKPYDVGFEYNPRHRASAPSAPFIVAPRATYPSVMLPNPMTIWSIEGAVSASHAITNLNPSSDWSVPAQDDCYPTTNVPTAQPTMQTPTGWSVPAQDDCYPTTNVPTAQPTMQTLTGWSTPTQYDVDDDVQWIPSPLSSCPSLGSDISSRESSPLDTPTRANSIPTSVEEATQNFADIDVFFKDLYQGLSPEWSSVLQSWPDETEMPFAQ
jgi:hypothetical protein